VRDLFTYTLASLFLTGSVYADKFSNPESLSLLRSGEVLQVYTRMDESGGAVRAKIFIHTGVEEIRAILQGCGKAFVFVDGMEQCEILKQTDGYSLIHQVVDTGLLAPELDYSYESNTRAYSQMDFKLVEGNLRVLEGGWEFLETDDGVFATYNMRVRPGFPIPRFLVRMSLRRMIPDMLVCIRGLVDGSGSPEQKKKDLDQCPGDV
jgi:hypothetical protein